MRGIKSIFWKTSSNIRASTTGNKFNLNIIPVYIERTDSESFILEFKEIINTSEFSDKILLTKKLNEILEQMIKQNPHQWIWTHNRWK